MNCKNSILEHNSKRQCWFPKDANSPFDFCIRCSYYRVDEILHSIAKGDFTAVHFLEDTSVQSTCLQEKQFDSFLSALTALCKANHPSFPILYTCVEDYIRFQQAFLRHSPSSRCCLYQSYLSKQSFSSKEAHITDLPWKCWTCLAWILRQKDTLGLYQAFIRGMLSNASQASLSTCDPSSLIDCMISLELKGKAHATRTLFEWYRRAIQNDTKAREVLDEFHCQPAMIYYVFTDPYFGYYPTNWEINTVPKKALKSVRKRNWVFKEELIMRTWAPHRLFPWCFDIQELADFSDDWRQQ